MKRQPFALGLQWTEHYACLVYIGYMFKLPAGTTESLEAVLLLVGGKISVLEQCK